MTNKLEPFSFEVKYTCYCCGDCPDFADLRDKYDCAAQADDFFFKNQFNPYGTIHPKCPKRKGSINENSN